MNVSVAAIASRDGGHFQFPADSAVPPPHSSSEVPKEDLETAYWTWKSSRFDKLARQFEETGLSVKHKQKIPQLQLTPNVPSSLKSTLTVVPRVRVLDGIDPEANEEARNFLALTRYFFAPKLCRNFLATSQVRPDRVHQISRGNIPRLTNLNRLSILAEFEVDLAYPP